MALKIKLNALQSEISLVKRMLSRVQKDDVLARQSLEHRLEILTAQFDNAIASTEQMASVALIFAGTPVRGSETINMSFASQVLRQYQEIIFSIIDHKSGYVNRKNKKNTNKTKKKEGSLYISGIIHGSFGFILEEDRMQYELVETATKSAVLMADSFLMDIANYKKDIRDVLDAMDAKVFRNIRSFFKTLYDEESVLKISERERIIDIDEDKIIIAHERMVKNKVEEDDITFTGTLMGFSPVKRSFDFQRDIDKEIFSGKVEAGMAQAYMDFFERYEVSDSQLSMLLGERYKAVINVKNVETADGENLPPKYTLLSIDKNKD